MADAAAELERRIQRLNIRYDGLPDDRVADKKKLEDEIRALRDQLDELRQPQHVAPEPSPPPAPPPVPSGKLEAEEAVSFVVDSGRRRE
jgi:hypothetical protein